MFRRGLFLVLVGAVVAKAQSLVEILHAPAGPGVLFGGAPQAHSIATADMLKPRSGYCGVCGTKGEPVGVIVTGEVLARMTNYAVDPTNGFTASLQAMLRCPHCGTLFTNTETNQ